jgi:hypothetical protein
MMETNAIAPVGRSSELERVDRQLRKARDIIVIYPNSGFLV